VRLPARGRAAGKVILLGEHAVVYGRPALAAGLGMGLTVELAPAAGPARLESDRPELADDPRPQMLLAEAAAALDLPARDFVARVRSELPAGAGFGSSAALAVALVRALGAAAGRPLDAPAELALGRRLETVFHGHPSGIDPAAAALGTCFRFVRGEPPIVTPLRPRAPVPLAIAFSGCPRSTGAAVGALRGRWEREPDRYEALFDGIAATVEAGREALVAGDHAALGAAFDRNQALLEAIGVSSAEVEELARVARRAGALGAKLTGGGAGGAVIALAPDTERVAAALRAHGARTVVARLEWMREETA